MGSRLYTSGAFAEKAGVSVRTVRYYDQVGLLRPSRLTEAGYRLYADEDLGTLQQILALKLLGFSLDEIRVCLSAGPRRLTEILAQQRAMLREQRAHLDAIILAIDRAIEEIGQPERADQLTWRPIVGILEVMKVAQNRDWLDKYFTPEQREELQKQIDTAYTKEALDKLAARGPWTEEDQRRADEQWARVNAELSRLVAAGADPVCAEAQAWAKAYGDLIGAFTQGDPDIAAGLDRFWQQVQALPEGERPLPGPTYTQEETEFMVKALAAYREGRGGATS